MDEDVTLEDLAKRYPGEAPYVAGDLDRIAGLFANEATRDDARATLNRWIEGAAPLRKAMAEAWLAEAEAGLEKNYLGVLGAAANPFDSVQGYVNRHSAATRAAKKAKACPTCGQSMPMAKGEAGLEKGIDPASFAMGQMAGNSVANGRKLQAAWNKGGGFLGTGGATKKAKACPTCGQSMMGKDSDPDIDLQKLAEQYPNEAPYVARDIEVVGARWMNPETHEEADALLNKWAEHGEPLRKAMSTAWLSRARKLISAGAMKRGAKSGARAAETNPRAAEGAPQESHPRVEPRIEEESEPSGRMQPPEPPPKKTYFNPKGPDQSTWKTIREGVKSWHRNQPGHGTGLNGPRLNAKHIALSYAAGMALGLKGGYQVGLHGPKAIAHHYLSSEEREERRNAGKHRWKNHTPMGKDEGDELDLQKLAEQYPGQVPYVAADIERVGARWMNPETHEEADALLNKWAEHGEPLRKAMSGAWLSRAKNLISSTASALKSRAKSAGKTSGSRDVTVHDPHNPHYDEKDNWGKIRGHLNDWRRQAQPGGRGPNESFINQPMFSAKHALMAAGSGAMYAAPSAYWIGENGPRGMLGVFGRLSEKQRKQRRDAANARWRAKGKMGKLAVSHGHPMPSPDDSSTGWDKNPKPEPFEEPDDMGEEDFIPADGQDKPVTQISAGPRIPTVKVRQVTHPDGPTAEAAKNVWKKGRDKRRAAMKAKWAKAG